MIRWVTDKLGTGPCEKVRGCSGVTVVDVRDMVDKEGNSVAVVRTKIENALEHLRSGHKVVICCDYGISRSNALAAGVLARVSDLPFSEALKRVTAATGQHSIKIELVSCVRSALEESSSSLCQHAFDPARKKVMITGSSGYVGSALARQLNESFLVSSPSREEVDLLKGPVELDLAVKNNGSSAIVHLAYPRDVGTNRSLGDSLTMLRNVLEVCRNNAIPLTYISSVVVFSGYQTDFLLASEQFPPFPQGAEAEAKYMSEVLINLHAGQTDLDHCIVRAGRIFGEQRKGPKIIGNFLEKALRNEEIVLHQYSNGFPTIDLLHLDDLVRGIVLAMENCICGYLHLGRGDKTYVKDVAELIIGLTHSNSAISFHKIASPAANVALKATRAETLLQWHPQVHLEEGLSRIVKEHDHGPIRG